MTDKSKSISDFISSSPLYKSIEVTGTSIPSATLNGWTFNFFCELDNEQKTFELSIVSYETPKEEYKHDLESNLTLSYAYKGICQHCKKFHVDVIINLYSKSELNEDGNTKKRHFIRKIGQYPPFIITPEKYLQSFLNKEDKENYKKALLLLSQSYGIGAFSYLRRIVENEILRIIEDISKLGTPASNKVQELLKAYKKNHQMTNLIEGIGEYLPGSLKSLGNNPIKVLYSQLSGGIHEYSESECLEKAELIDTLLKFVIKKINEESSDVLSARQAMEKLNNPKK